MKNFLLSLLVIMFCLPALAEETPSSVTFQWTPPTERVNGDALDASTEISYYDLRCWNIETPEEYTYLQIPGQSTEGSYTSTISELLPEYGYYECELAAVDAWGTYSDYVLAESDNPIPYLPPKPGTPTNILILIQ